MEKGSFLMKKQWTTVFLIILTLIVAIFAVMNVDPVIINFGFTSVQMPLAVILIVTLLIGVLMAVLLSTAIIIRYKSEQKKLNQEIKQLEVDKEEEKEELARDYEEQLKRLRDKNESLEKDIRDLKRRIKNMDTNSHLQNKSETNH